MAKKKIMMKLRGIILFVINLLVCLSLLAQNTDKLSEASRIILSDHLEKKYQKFKKLNQYSFCNEQNEIINYNNIAIQYMYEGRYLLATSYLKLALEKESKLNTNLDVDVLNYNKSIAGLYPGKNFCHSNLDSIRLELQKIPLKHESFGLNYYLGMADFYAGNFLNSKKYFTEDFRITASERSIFAEIYTTYLSGNYQESYNLWNFNRNKLSKFVNREIFYYEIIGNVCSKAGQHQEAISHYKNVNPKYWQVEETGGDNLTKEDRKSSNLKCYHFVKDTDLRPYVKLYRGTRTMNCGLEYMPTKYEEIWKINLAFEYLNLDKYSDADEIIKGFTNSEKRLSVALDYTRDYLKAISIYKIALEEYRNDGKIVKFYEAKNAFLNLSDKKGGEIDENIFIGIAFSAFYCKELALSRDYINRAKRLYPNNFSVREASAILSFIEKRDVDAVNEIEKILNDNPNYGFCYDIITATAYYYYLNGNAEFSTWYQKLESKYSDKSGYLSLSGLIHMGNAINSRDKENANSEALLAKDYFKKAIKSEPRQTTYYTNYANLLFNMTYGNLSHIFNPQKKSDSKEIIENYSKAIKYDPENSHAYNGKAMCYFHLWESNTKENGNLDSALNLVDKAIEMHSRLDNDIEFYRTSLTSLYLNKQWMLMRAAKNSKNKDSINLYMDEAWAVAEIGFNLIPSTKYMFQVNQAVGWSNLGDENRMNEFNNYCLKSSDSIFTAAVIYNNKGVYYSPQRNNLSGDISKSEKLFNQSLSASNNHFSQFIVNSNIINLNSGGVMTEIYYYLPITDFRPRNIELNINFHQPYFNPQLFLEFSNMETFTEDEVSSEECSLKHEINKPEPKNNISELSKPDWNFCPSEKKRLLSRLFKK